MNKGKKGRRSVERIGARKCKWDECGQNALYTSIKRDRTHYYV